MPELLRDLVHERTGIYFELERTGLMFEKLEARAIAHNCRSYLDYYYILRYDDTKSAEEWRRVMDAFSVQETYFWRELDQIRALVDCVVPAWFRQNTAPLRIWSAACATGEEPYSIVMALRDAGWGHHPIEVWASDSSEIALTKARAGVYRERSFRALPLALRAKYFTAQGEGWLLKSEISSQVKFCWANLVDLERATEIPPVQAIFCRNVFIYFSPGTIKRVLASFARRMPPEGHLFVGASESLLKLTRQFELKEIGGAFVYVREPGL
ncbi:MAG: protein-glutamate O-methyltransferase CheR [Opitutaceae bacterium]